MFKVSQDIHAAPIVLTRCRKLYCLGRRVHHGLTGELLIAAGLAFHRRDLTAQDRANRFRARYRAQRRTQCN